jgi:hypothetical protein
MIEAKERAMAEAQARFDEFESRQRAASASTQYLADSVEQAALAIAGGTQKATDAIRQLAVQLAIAAAKAAILGQGPLAGLFGPAALPGGQVSPAIASLISGGAGGLFARGGIADRPSIFGESGPEAAVPLPDGRRIPVDLRGSAGEAKVTVINQAPAGYETETRRRRGAGGETIVENITRRVGAAYGLRAPALAR